MRVGGTKRISQAAERLQERGGQQLCVEGPSCGSCALRGGQPLPQSLICCCLVSCSVRTAPWERPSGSAGRSSSRASDNCSSLALSLCPVRTVSQ